MKKLFALFLAVVMTLCLLAGCGKTETPAPATEETKSEETTEKKIPENTVTGDPNANGLCDHFGKGPAQVPVGR